MEFAIQYWHWIVFGMLLILAELVVPSFTIFWFGLGAFIIAALLALSVEISLSWQLLIWALSSTAFTLLWFQFFRPLMRDHTKAGIAREAIRGESGQVIRAPEEGQRGIVRFSTPLLGDDEWEFICSEPVSLGDRVFVLELSGNTLIVEKR
ncbi:NfeD family protein [Marinobacterium sp. D7]|uniref:NfeD family protein n=1 Tax=Marinobacterium ramblicola TaxID=2849041 RepID=UPI001C2D8714|nr:NfeD family protein [Marinobacterium ramblicola]MBV1788726.1 NfeD family protein [Marinobacterium ramblicola]